jgi:hypothetical protein
MEKREKEKRERKKKNVPGNLPHDLCDGLYGL